MIARIGTFTALSAETAAASKRNLHERFLPALRAQAGFVLGLWLEHADGTLASITVWESAEAMATAAQRANATPLLPGQDGTLIPSPHIVELYTVDAYAGGHGDATTAAPRPDEGG